MLEGVKRRASMCQANYLTFIFARNISFQSATIFPCPKGTTQISHGSRTKRAAPILFESNRLVLLPCFSASKCSLAKIAIPFTIYPSLNLVEFYVRISQSASSCGLASWMRPQQLRNFYCSLHSLAKNVIPCTILSLAQFNFIIEEVSQNYRQRICS